MIFDQNIFENQIKQFASQWNTLSEKDKKLIQSQFELNQSTEFYKGLLAGFTASFVLITQGNLDINTTLPKTVGSCISYISHLFIEKKI